MGKNVLVVVDMQNDFIDKALGTPEAQAIVQNVIKKINGMKNGATILVTRDTHYIQTYFSSLEGKKLPVAHCIKGTDGWEVNADVQAALDKAAERGVTVKYFDKPTFGSKELANWWITPEEEIEVVGLCTSICVLSNALLLRAAHPNTVIKVDQNATACVTPESKEAALAAMKMCQIDVI